MKPPLSFPGEDSLAKHICACLAITCSRVRRADLCLSPRRNAQIEDLRCSRSSTILLPCESTRWMTAPPECSVRQHGRHVCQQYGCFHTVKALHQPRHVRKMLWILSGKIFRMLTWLLPIALLSILNLRRRSGHMPHASPSAGPSRAAEETMGPNANAYR